MGRSKNERVKRRGDADPLIVFEGRDSLGFLYAYSQRHSQAWIYSPGSRAAFYNCAWSKDRSKWEEEQKASVEFYKRKGIIGRDLIFVDYGYGGTISRLEQLSLMQFNEPRGRIRMLLAVTLPAKSALKSKKGRFVFDPTRKKEFVEADREMIREREEYFDDLPVEKPALPLPISGFWDKEWLKLGPPFLSTLQELPAYIKESPPKTFDKPTSAFDRSLAFDSIYGIVAKYAFFRGLISSDMKNLEPSPKEVAKVVSEFYNLSRKYPFTYGVLADIGDRLRENPAMEKVLKRTNRILIGKKLPRVHS